MSFAILCAFLRQSKNGNEFGDAQLVQFFLESSHVIPALLARKAFRSSEPERQTRLNPIATADSFRLLITGDVWIEAV